MTVLAHPLWTTLSQGVDDRRQRAKMMDELCSSLRKGDVALLLATCVDGSQADAVFALRVLHDRLAKGRLSPQNRAAFKAAARQRRKSEAAESEAWIASDFCCQSLKAGEAEYYAELMQDTGLSEEDLKNS